MHLEVSEELREICRQILAEGSTVADWQACASGDSFQSEHFCGGFEEGDEDEGGAFWFSYYPVGMPESWLRLTVAEVVAIAAGSTMQVTLQPPR